LEIPHESESGLYLAWPVSDELQSIYKRKNYKTLVNNQHTKFGQAKHFGKRARGYVDNFTGGCKFEPVVIVALEHLDEAETAVKQALRAEFNNVGNASEWLDSTYHNLMSELMIKALVETKIPHTLCDVFKPRLLKFLADTVRAFQRGDTERAERLLTDFHAYVENDIGYLEDAYAVVDADIRKLGNGEITLDEIDVRTSLLIQAFDRHGL
jgi:hypothetical protein